MTVTVFSILFALLLYLSIQFTLFLFCCENNLHLLSSIRPELTGLSQFFGVLIHYNYRIYIAYLIYPLILIYTIFLALYAHEYKLNIYPAMLCMLSNVTAFVMFEKIVIFLKECRKGCDEEKTNLFAR